MIRPSAVTASARWISLVCLLGLLAILCGTGVPRPVTAADQRTGFRPEAVAITGARIIAGPGQIVERGTLVTRNGIIVAVGPEIPIPPDARVIDAAGLTVYPGFIDAAASRLLDPEKKPSPEKGREANISRHALAATQADHRNSLTLAHSTSESLKIDKDIWEKLRRAGFTSAHVVPDGRIAGGQTSLVSLSQSPLREVVVKDAVFSEFELFAPGGETYPSTLMGAHAHLRQTFLDAERHRLHWTLWNEGAPVERPPGDAGLERLQEVRDGKLPPLFRASSRDDIHRALDFCAEHGLRPTLLGGKEAHRCLDRLKEEEVDLILRIDFGDEPKIEPAEPTAELQEEVKDPLRAQEDRREQWKERVASLKQLHAAGVRFAAGSEGLDSPDDMLKQMRRAIEHGLSPEAALGALCWDAAKIAGSEDRLGTLAPGKLAHVVVMTGPFEQESSKVRYVLVDGETFEYNADATPEAAPGEPDATADLAGRWQVEISSEETAVTAQLELAQNGARLTGTLTSDQGVGKLTSGTVEGQKVRFVVAIGAGDRAVELKFEGDLKEAKLSGMLKSAFGAPIGWSAVRPEAGAPQANPVELSIADDPAEAPASAETPSIPEQPTELRSDRTRRVLQTGGNLLVKNATVLTGTGQTLPNTSILVREGKIAEIGPDLEAEEGLTVIDASGRYVMPGIIDTHSHIMIAGGVNEATQSIVAEVRVQDVVNADDLSTYRALAGGVTTARLLHGSANVIGGQHAVVKLKHGATAAEHVVKDAPVGVKFALGENVKFRTNRFPNTRMGVEATLNRAFLEAVDYRRRWMQYEQAKGKGEEALLPPRRDLRLEALAEIVNHEKFIHCHCYRADEILMLLRVTSNLGMRVWSLQHVLEGYKVAPEIVAHGASCSTFSDWWAYKVEAYDATPFNAALLHEAGANIVLKSDDPELIRHMYQEAAKLVRYGNMPPDAALQTITLNSARELGLSDRIGSIEVGKEADLAIFSGHPLNAFSRCEYTIIEGEVCFSRKDQPSATTTAAAERAASPGDLPLAPTEHRARVLEIGPSVGNRYALVGATLHPVDGPAIAAGTLLIEGDRIAKLGRDVPVPEACQAIDVTGLHVYPGLIDAGTTLGLVEIGKVRETNDFSESGGLQPDLRAGVALNTDSELIPVGRAGGITTALVRPTGGIIAGQASLAKLAGWTVPDMLLDYEAGLQIFWPAGDKAKEQRQELQDFFDEARIYEKARSAAAEGEPSVIEDPRYEAMRPYLKGERPVFIEADSRQHIAEAMLFAEKEKLKVIITGGADAWKLADELKAREVPVIVGPVMRGPVAEYDPFDAPYANPGRLHDAGVTFCIRSNSASNSRNVPFEAAMAVSYGLPEEAALRAVTLSAAEVLGIGDRLGSLTEGKIANLIVTDGSPLQPSTQIKAVFIDGTPHPVESRQTRFYEKYRGRLHALRAEQQPITAGGTAPADSTAPVTESEAGAK